MTRDGGDLAPTGSLPAGPARDSPTWTMRIMSIGLMIGLATGLAVAIFVFRPARTALLFAPGFPRDGLVTNEYAHFNPTDPGSRQSPDWEMTSGSLFARDGVGWSGVSDSAAPDALSRLATDSAVFRLVSRRGFEDISVRLEMRVLRFVVTPRTPARAWDGVHLWLRYRDPNELYYVSIARRDGTTVIGKKLPVGTRGGRYVVLAAIERKPVRTGAWQRVEATVQTNRDGSVSLRVTINGTLVARSVDQGGTGTPVVSAPGRVGLRADNAEFEFRQLEVRSL